MFIQFSVTEPSRLWTVVCVCASHVQTYLARQSRGPDGDRLGLIDCTEVSVTGQGAGEKDRLRRGGDGGMHFDDVPVRQTSIQQKGKKRVE